MRILGLLTLCLLMSTVFYAQNTNPKRGTIKVRKLGQLVKVEYDPVNYRLIGIDQYGNVLENAVEEFQLSVTINGVFYTEKAIGSTLTNQMQGLLQRCDSNTPLFFKNIKARTSDGSLIDIPKFQHTIGKFDHE